MENCICFRCFFHRIWIATVNNIRCFAQWTWLFFSFFNIAFHLKDTAILLIQWIWMVVLPQIISTLSDDDCRSFHCTRCKFSMNQFSKMHLTNGKGRFFSVFCFIRFREKWVYISSSLISVFVQLKKKGEYHNKIVIFTKSVKQFVL